MNEIARQGQTEFAGLTYGDDSGRGIHRRRSGKGFHFIGVDGGTITDAKILHRIKSLAIPPAWKDVWISPKPTGHIQATGRDARGRKQYRYHSLWTACRDEVKYSSLVDFARALPQLRKHIEEDLRSRGLQRERVLASVIWLLDHALIRVGNTSYRRDNGSFGLTTLRDRHVDIDGSTLRFAFRGKSGKEWKLTISDRRVAKIVKSAQDLPGQHLFQYFDENGQRRPVESQDVNAYIRQKGGADFSSKHFRTWAATVAATCLLNDTDLPETKHETARALNAVIDTVAADLGNTRAICRKCYIHPATLKSWSEARLSEELSSIKIRQTPKGYTEDEYLVLKWLQKFHAPNDENKSK
ncbi:DNA topoisomerase IB [Mesorhizobium sp. CGMCC 1.15528]|uniref:DNA topoisomerase n=1 Tax=Mesorhizobium zhangyense TaxID=1776730 RepID=A0A7C9VGR9_9HYPH|nr:DNA topoisomerase IB [Mesorhizobium zhangyense]NGN45069.1 DNA topoisomerase IB [Mesorhizobium zhangyense]